MFWKSKASKELEKYERDIRIQKLELLVKNMSKHIEKPKAKFEVGTEQKIIAHYFMGSPVLERVKVINSVFNESTFQWDYLCLKLKGTIPFNVNEDEFYQKKKKNDK